MLRGNTGLCYDQSLIGNSEFLSLTSQAPLHRSYQDMTTMFAFTDDVASPSYHLTCFGQDIAGYSEIVTVMVCATFLLMLTVRTIGSEGDYRKCMLICS